MLGVREEEEKGGERKKGEEGRTGEGRDGNEEECGANRKSGVARRAMNPSALRLTCGYFKNNGAHCAC